MFGGFAAALLGVPLFLFVFWKKLKEDYVGDSIFATAFFILLGVFLGKVMSLGFFTNFWFWESILLAFLGLIIGVIKYKLRFYEVLEASVIGLLPWLTVLFLGNAILTSSLTSFLGFCLLTLLIGFYYFLDTHYKSFSWYASGRVGFSGLTILATFFLVRAALAGVSVGVLSLAGRIDSIISGILSFAIFLLIYNLAKGTS